MQKTSLTRLVMSAMAMASITMAVLPAQATPLPSCQPAIIDSNEAVSQVPAAAPPVEVAIKKKGNWKIAPPVEVAIKKKGGGWKTTA